MKTIYETFSSQEEAEEFQNDLYDKWQHVRLVKSPFFGSGIYGWRVAVPAEEYEQAYHKETQNGAR